MSVDNDEISRLQESLLEREKELEACKNEMSEKDERIQGLIDELDQTRSNLQEKIERLSTLISVADSMNSTLDLDQLLTYLMSCATKVMKAKDSSLMLVDERANELVFKIALGEKGAAVQEFRLKMGQGIAGQVALSGEPIIVADTSKDDRFASEIDMATGFETKSVMCVPIKLRERVIGVIEVLNAGYAETVTEDDVEVFSAFASAAGVALQNARLFSAIQHSVEHICTLVKSGAIMTDENGELVMINTIAKELLGFGETEPVTIESIIGLQSDKSITTLLRTAFEQAETIDEKIVLSENGGKEISLEITPVIDPNGMKIGTVAVLSKA